MQAAIYLDAKLPKCVAKAAACARKDACALYLVRADGRKLADYSTGCTQYLPASAHRSPPAAQPKTHDYVKGLA